MIEFLYFIKHEGLFYLFEKSYKCELVFSSIFQYITLIYYILKLKIKADCLTSERIEINIRAQKNPNARLIPIY